MNANIACLPPHLKKLRWNVFFLFSFSKPFSAKIKWNCSSYLLLFPKGWPDFRFCESPGTKKSLEKSQFGQRNCAISWELKLDVFCFCYFASSYLEFLYVFGERTGVLNILAIRPLFKGGPKTLLSNWIWDLYQIILKGCSRLTIKQVCVWRWRVR